MALTQVSTAGVKDDAVTSGKIPANAVGSSELADNAVDTAAIADDAVTAAKLANDIAISTTGTITTTGNNLTIQGNNPKIIFTETNDNPDFKVEANAGEFKIIDSTNSADRVTIDSSGKVGIGQNNPNVPLHVYHATTNGVATFESGDANALVNFRDNSTTNSPSLGAAGNSLTLLTGSAERVRLDSAGRLMIGTTAEGHSNADDLTVNNSANCGITIRSGSSNDGNIFFSDDTSGNGETRGVIKYKHADDALVFNSNGNERMRIDSSGRVLIGTTSGSNTLTVSGNIATSGDVILTTDDEKVQLGASQDFLLFHTNDKNYVYGVGNYPTLFHTNNQERLRIQAGGGISFNGDTAAANALDDYEEGTWTPTINSSLNANIAVGRYVKVGSLVMASARLDWNSNSGAGGGIGMGGLPFNTHDNTYTRTAGSIGYMIGLDTSGNHQVVIGAVQGTSNIYVQLLNDNGAGFAIGAQNCSNAGEIQLTITYRTDA